EADTQRSSRESVGILDEERDPLAAADAERRQAVADPAAPHLMNERRGDARSGRPDGVSQGDRAPVHVVALQIEAEVPLAGEDLDGEGLVDLDQVDTVQS